MADNGGADPVKVCTGCGLDVAGLKRWKDPKGKYWCDRCYHSAVQRSRERTASASTLHTAETATSAGEVASDSDELIPLADDLTAPVPGHQQFCPRCHAPMSDGDVLCVRCGLNLETNEALDTHLQRPKTLVEEVATATAVGTSIIVTSIVGAAVWTIVALQFRVEISWLAILLGVLVGVSTALGARGRAGMLTGALAAAIAILSLVGARVAMVSIEVDQFISRQIDDELAIDVIASEMRIEAGESVAGGWFRKRGFAFVWPKMSWDEARAEARSFWYDELADEDRTAALAMMAQEFEVMQADLGAVKEQGVMGSLHWMDGLFAFVAVAAAYGTGSGGTSREE